ncbi:unnamed protein product [Cyclocybe aegerita]|uniref:Uncharacterized protein n=1 Tax=Cyclocybe aegerita TaxID=1973307 RepID=A0A8S0XM53_CYCAE|nr:unnamed protein product [Cyclocybe aegerita]
MYVHTVSSVLQYSTTSYPIVFVGSDEVGRQSTGYEFGDCVEGAVYKPGQTSVGTSLLRPQISHSNTMTSPGKIFNVEQVTSKDQVAFETTAAEARLDAPNRVAARQVEENARKEKESAEQVASIVKTLGPKYTGEPATAVGQFRGDSDSSKTKTTKSATEQLQASASKTTNVAVAEGKHDVEEAKVATSTYVQQAKELANSAIETSQAYLPTSMGGKPENTPSASRSPSMLAGEIGSGIASQIQTTAANVYTAAVETAQLHVERARGHIENAKGVAQGYMATAGMQDRQLTEKLGTAQVPPASSTGTPATTTPLKSGQHNVGTPDPDVHR